MANDQALFVEDVSKSYARVQAVDHISFDVHFGEIFGLLGPNGAGKTTTIRMILDIIKPNSGQISVLGGPMTEEKKGQIGYLPEERGLYEDMKLMDVLLFLGQLKGLSRQEATQRAREYLRKVDLWEAHDRKISALSRGMTQKAQFVAAIMHQPRLIIIDEPFSGLDPVNTRVIKELLYDLRDGGAAIIMSTHQMFQVEEMCQRILLINHGERVLYGTLKDIRRDFEPNAVEVELSGEVPQIPGVAQMQQNDGVYRLVLEDGVAREKVLRFLVDQPGVTVKRFEGVEPSLDDIFVRVVSHDLPAGENAG